MASGRPVLLSVDGEARSILEANRAGLYYPAMNSDGLVNAIIKLKLDPESALQMGSNGRNYAVTHCSREQQDHVMIDFLMKIKEADTKYV